MGSALSGRGFGQARKARPLHACLGKVAGGAAKNELERLVKPRNWNCAREDFASQNRVSGREQVDSGTLVPANRGYKRHGTVDCNGGE